MFDSATEETPVQDHAAQDDRNEASSSTFATLTAPIIAEDLDAFINFAPFINCPGQNN